MRHAIEHFWGVLMGTTDLVRSSRDGDQFHYLWASRRALLLLDPKSNLHTITIEGPSKTEFENGYLEDGEEIIDVDLCF